MPFEIPQLEKPGTHAGGRPRRRAASPVRGDARRGRPRLCGATHAGGGLACAGRRTPGAASLVRGDLGQSPRSDKRPCPCPCPCSAAPMDRPSGRGRGDERARVPRRRRARRAARRDGVGHCRRVLAPLHPGGGRAHEAPAPLAAHVHRRRRPSELHLIEELVSSRRSPQGKSERLALGPIPSDEMVELVESTSRAPPTRRAGRGRRAPSKLRPPARRRRTGEGGPPRSRALRHERTKYQVSERVLRFPQLVIAPNEGRLVRRNGAAGVAYGGLCRMVEDRRKYGGD